MYCAQALPNRPRALILVPTRELVQQVRLGLGLGVLLVWLPILRACMHPDCCCTTKTDLRGCIALRTCTGIALAPPKKALQLPLTCSHTTNANADVCVRAGSGHRQAAQPQGPYPSCWQVHPCACQSPCDIVVVRSCCLCGCVCGCAYTHSALIGADCRLFPGKRRAAVSCSSCRSPCPFPHPLPTFAHLHACSTHLHAPPCANPLSTNGRLALGA